MIVFLWLLFSFLVGVMGSDRKIGFWSSLFLSLILSPLIGFLFVILSDKPKNPEATNHYRSAIKNYNIGKIDYAIQEMIQSINLLPGNPESHYKLSTYYSLNEQEKPALHSLQKAIELGFSDFGRIKNDPDLNWLRNQKNFEQFEESGFKNGGVPSKDYLTQLKELGELLKQEIITAEEFEVQKARILNNQ